MKWRLIVDSTIGNIKTKSNPGAIYIGRRRSSRQLKFTRRGGASM